MKRTLLMGLLMATLAACGERDQSLATGSKPDTKPWQAAQTPYTVKGWTAGDKTTWEAQMRTRSQTQNEYAKVE
ncbi:MAG TPA: hypothetical protein DIT28_15890 [Oxalobacteraceae bacterium]|jgi:hypothetical protein|nr:hypothetical protein [Oxalobacteraceae bacterium]HCN90633.1 hypothetical protein [Oxalobacteraceae bacterium]